MMKIKQNQTTTPTSGENRQPFISEMSRRSKLKFFIPYLKPGMCILEIGAGDGWFSRRLREQGFNVKTCDLCPPADYVGDIRNFEAFGIAPASFDALIAFEVIEHIDIIPTARRLLSPDGLLLLTSPYPPADPLLALLEKLGLCQRRTSPHVNLIDFRTIPLAPVIIRRRLGLAQWGVFRN